MKLLLVLLLLSPNVYAKEYKFTWKTDKETIQYKTNSDSWEVAFERASTFCFNLLAKKEVLTEDKGLEIIDICVNPR